MFILYKTDYTIDIHSLVKVIVSVGALDASVIQEIRFCDCYIEDIISCDTILFNLIYCDEKTARKCLPCCFVLSKIIDLLTEVSK